MGISRSGTAVQRPHGK